MNPIATIAAAIVLGPPSVIWAAAGLNSARRRAEDHGDIEFMQGPWPKAAVSTSSTRAQG